MGRELVGGGTLHDRASLRGPLVDLDLTAGRIERRSGPHRRRSRATAPPVDQPEPKVDQARAPVVPVGAIGRALHGLISWMVGHGWLPARRGSCRKEMPG